MTRSRTPASRVDLALLLLRVGFGLSMLLFHGWGKISGGPAVWTQVGSTMQNLGIDFLPTFWGFAAALTESVGSILILLGLFFRPAAALLAFTMVIATIRHLALPPEAATAGWAGASHALEYLVVWIVLFLTGPGRHALVTPRWLKRR